jgi:hypothetical protein
MRVDTHRLFNTISHSHLDSLVNWATGEYPDSGLLLVECADCRWFVEVDFGNDYNAIGGVSKPKILPYMDPVFFESRKDGEAFAFECIKKIHRHCESETWDSI